MIIIICLGIIAAIFFGDQWIKNRVEHMVEGNSNNLKEYFGGIIKVRRHHNRGAMLNFGQSYQNIITILSVILSVVAFIVFLCSLGRKGNNLLRIGMAFLLGGAFSNTYDRLKRKYVVDYVSFGVTKILWGKETPWKECEICKKFENIVFNISDFCILIGAVMTVFGAEDN